MIQYLIEYCSSKIYKFKSNYIKYDFLLNFLEKKFKCPIRPARRQKGGSMTDAAQTAVFFLGDIFVPPRPTSAST